MLRTTVTSIQQFSSTIPTLPCDHQVTSIISSELSNKFPDIDELYSISQSGTTIRNNLGVEVSASQIHCTTDKTTTRALRGLNPKMSKAQIALESQKRFDCMEKTIKAGKETANLKRQTKPLQPRKKKASHLLDDFPELKNGADEQV